MKKDIKMINFIKFNSKTNQNKKLKYVNIDFDELSNNLKIDGSSFKGITNKETIIGTWWNFLLKQAQISAFQEELLNKK